jgi:uncharacterized protein DUF1236
MKSLLLASTAAAAIAFAAAFAGAQPEQTGKAHSGGSPGQSHGAAPRQHGPDAAGPQQRDETEGNPARVNPGHSAATGNERQPAEFRHPGKEQSTELPTRHGQPGANRRPQEERGLTGASQPAPPENAQIPSRQANPSTPLRSEQVPRQRHSATVQPKPPAEPSNRAAESRQGRELRSQAPTLEQQRFRAQEQIGAAGLHWTARPGFSVSVGAVVPRGEHLYALPPTIARRLPQYRGARYIAFRDRIAIVEPHTLKVIAVLPAAAIGIGAGFAGSSLPPRETALVLSAQQRQRISARIREVSLRPGFAIAVGAVVPTGVELLPVPPQIVAVAPQLRDFRYVSTCGRFAIVDPQTMRIVVVLPG